MAKKHQEPSGESITILKVGAYERLGIAVSSNAIGEDGRLDPIYSTAEDNRSPPLAWSGIAEAETYVLVVEDADAPTEAPFIHWMIWNIPGRLIELPAGVPVGKLAGDLAGAVQGLNDVGEHGWTGMNPPPGDGRHHYHFQLFAMNRSLDLAPDATLPVLLNELKSGTLAKGEVVGTFEAPEEL